MMISILILLLLGITVVSSYADASLLSPGFNSKFTPIMPEDTAANTLSDFILIEEEAQFPGGDDAMESYFMNNIQYPFITLEQKIEGKVSVSFTINQDGSVDNVQILQGIGGGCEEVIMQALYNMPKWTPQKQAGNYVSSKNKFSFTFKL